MMKVLIVDDEKHVREAIRYFVPWEKYTIDGIYEATNGQEAIDTIMEHQPAIVFTDMRMPLLDGAELLEWLHKHSPNTKTIVISGYQDFNYVKPAIVYGGIDYLLKPLNSKQLIAAAEQAFQLWQEEEQARKRACLQNMQLNVLRPLYWDKTLSDLVSGKASFQEIKLPLMEELGLPEDSDNCRVAVISLQSANCRLLHRFQGDLQLTSFALANVCNEIVSPQRSGFTFRYWQTGVDIVILFWDAVAEAENSVQDINESIKRAYGVQVDIGLSYVHLFPEELGTAFGEALKTLGERNLLQREDRIHLFREGHEQAESGKERDFLNFLDKLRISVLSGDPGGVARTVDHWAEQLGGMTILTESRFRRWQGEIREVLMRWRPDVMIPMDICYDDEGLFTVEGWKNQMKSLLLALHKDNKFPQPSDSGCVQEIRSYLDQNYHQEMTLQHIAERFFISRENVSRKFKQVTGENLSEYLTRLRIEKAKTLLQNTTMRLTQISELVGYEDEKYFSRVFKKTTGQTPREYRKQSGG